MESEKNLIWKVKNYFEKRGWTSAPQTKIRGVITDFAAIKNNEILIVETKAKGNIENAISQIIHLKKAADYTYLALPSNRITQREVTICRGFGIGLISIENKIVKKLLKAQRGDPLPSVSKQILGTKPSLNKFKTQRTHLEKLFRSKGLINILKLFFVGKQQEYHLKEISRQLGLSAPYLVAELKTLLEIGLLTRRQQGNMLMYSINKNNIIIEELKRIFLKYEMIDQVISRYISNNQIKYALIYGSFAKGTETSSSDIDLLVIGNINEDMLLRGVMNAQNKTGRQINFILWTNEELMKKTRESIPLIRELSNNPIIMVVGQENEFKRLIKTRSS